MNFFGFFTLLAAFATLSMGVYVYAKNPLHDINRSFLILCLGALYWISTFLAFTQSSNIEYASFWRRAFSFWPFIIPLQFQFILVFTEKRRLLRNYPLLLFLLVPPSLVTLFELNGVIFDELVLKDWGWVEINSLNLAFVSTSIWGVVMGILSLIVAHNFYRTVEHPLKKKQAKFVFLGLLIPNILGTLSQIIFSSLSFRFPDLTIPAVGLMCFLIDYGISKHQLFALNPIAAVDSIFDFMTEEAFGKSISEQSFDLIYAVDSQGKIVYLSPSFEEIMGYERSEVAGKTFQDFLPPEDMVDINLALLKFIVQPTEKLDEWVEAEIRFKRKDNSIINLITRSKPIVVKGNLYGVQGIAKDITDRKKNTV